MSYSTPTEMKARFKETELVDLTNPNDLAATEIVDAALQVALDDASGEIDALLAKRYTTPIESPPTVLVSVCCAIARYNLYSGRSTEEVETRYTNATKLLKEMANGKVDLGVNSGTTDQPTFSKPDSVFNVGMMGSTK